MMNRKKTQTHTRMVYERYGENKEKNPRIKIELKREKIIHLEKYNEHANNNNNKI